MYVNWCISDVVTMSQGFSLHMISAHLSCKLKCHILVGACVIVC